jgi:hypothetical protein
MVWFLVPVVAILLLVVPFFAADSRDGADWKPAALRRPARGTRRTLTFSQSPGALAVRKVASSAFSLTNVRNPPHAPGSPTLPIRPGAGGTPRAPRRRRAGRAIGAAAGARYSAPSATLVPPERGHPVG